MNNEIEVNAFYRHYKGGTYKILNTAIHSETLEDMVVYQALYGDMKIYTRPLKMFIEKININNELVDRFKKI